MYFLLEYESGKGKLLSITSYSDDCSEQARKERLTMELKHHRAKNDVEAILLEAKDQQALHTTHRRYFDSMDQLARLAGSST
jgi:hypothetical protein